MIDLRARLEARVNELRQAEEETVAQLWAIRGAIQELETVTLPMIEEQVQDDQSTTDTPETTV